VNGPPYAGPLVLTRSGPASSDVVARSGAAGQVLRCDGKIHWGDSGHDARPDGGASTATARAALAGFTAAMRHYLPQDGYRFARSAGRRVLFTFDVAGRPRVAVIVLNRGTGKGKAGWVLDSYASCDFSELPPSAVPDSWVQVWTDRTGKPVPTDVIESGPGPAHCDLTTVTLLTLAGRRQYARDPDGKLTKELAHPYRATATLPTQARDSGFRRDGAALWLTDDAAYLVSPQNTELWPRSDVGCA
jgi:hypothetical protein